MAFDMALQMKPPNTSFLPQRQSSLTIFSRNRRHLLNQPTPNNKQTVPPFSNETSNDVSPYGSIRGWIRQIDGMNKRDYRINPGRANNVTSYASNRRSMNMRGPDGKLPSKLRKIESRLIECITSEIMDIAPNVCWDDIAGLHHAKNCVTEMVIWPWLRPDVFKGCLSPGRGLLLFGPPGTGKTMIGKAIAGEANATFFYISTSSLTGKYVGDDEKLVRALFGVASCCQPAVIFVDEIDSLLSKRSDDYESECSRGLKTQFFIEMDGLGSGNHQILIIGATNRPQDLDEAARRRFTKQLYIPLPSSGAGFLA